MVKKETDGDGNTHNSNNRLVGSTYEIVNTEYSTGDYIEGIDYKYYYITMDNESLVNKANSLIEKSKSLDVDKANSISLKLDAMENYQKALVKDPDNIFLNEKLNELQKDEGVQTNIMLQFIVDMIALPIKIVLCIIDYILQFFKTMKILEIPKKVPEFFSFKWILDFIKPTKILELLGIKLNLSNIPKWSMEALTNTNLKFDASQITAAPFLGKLPIFNSSQFLETIKGGSKIGLSTDAILKFLQSLINEMICFILNIFNIDKLFPCPKINLTKLGDENLKQSDIDEILKESDSNFLNGDNTTQDEIFIYNIKLSNGNTVLGLNQEELNEFISNNKNLEYRYI